MRLLACFVGGVVAAGVLACGPGDGGIPECKAWLRKVDDCGGWNGLDEAWCDSFGLYVEKGCDCIELFEWYQKNTTCEDGAYGWKAGSGTERIPTCEC